MSCLGSGRNVALIFALAAAMISALSLPAHAADYPERNIRVVVPFAAAGTRCRTSAPQAITHLLVAEIDQWARIIRSAGIQVRE